MSAWRGVAAAMVLAAVPCGLAAQGGNVAARLVARGLPADLSQQVAAIAADAAQRGLPATPLADKAVEGWAKQIPATRILAAVRTYAGRLQTARDAVVSAGQTAPPGAVVAAAAEAIQGGLDADDVAEVVRAAPTPPEAAAGLTVAAALVAQGLGGGQAVAVVVRAMKNHQSMSQLLNLPSLARAMHAEGMTPGEIGRQMMEGADQGARLGAPKGDGPPGVPPGLGRNPPHPTGNPGRP